MDKALIATLALFLLGPCTQPQQKPHPCTNPNLALGPLERPDLIHRPTTVPPNTCSAGYPLKYNGGERGGGGRGNDDMHFLATRAAPKDDVSGIGFKKTSHNVTLVATAMQRSF